ncbi:hypothetical protein CLOACE_18330 [Clostridium acetireducens DSM 10703]|uniref:DUF4230 domain-containing protein n=1 Tax=Clostridium acetireducens DSM 10703 TaxID=1121290 RepID=A0A1E8EWZ6_9CLOT|nr:DUF4230 domain-containing protein [Clostridium acetireducens]OFI05309.1 hypothetical protein CLOACE_18330 [Clostridium acetireducens DSM 10703]
MKEKKIYFKFNKFIVVAFICIILLITNLIFSFKFLKENKIKDSSIIYERISKICELSTIKYNYSNVLAVKDAKKFNGVDIPLTKKSFLVKYDGYIKAGIDLKNSNIKTNVEGDSVELVLPKAKILDHSINEKNIFVYDERSAIFNKLTLKDMINEISDEKKKVEEDAINRGILNDANKNAENLLKDILKDMKFKNIKIIFK